MAVNHIRTALLTACDRTSVLPGTCTHFYPNSACGCRADHPMCITTSIAIKAMFFSTDKLQGLWHVHCTTALCADKELLHGGCLMHKPHTKFLFLCSDNIAQFRLITCVGPVSQHCAFMSTPPVVLKQPCYPSTSLTMTSRTRVCSS